eukprot:scaffold1184_cov132-Cylindrotheca_fusiformis.AAC.16
MTYASSGTMSDRLCDSQQTVSENSSRLYDSEFGPSLAPPLQCENGIKYMYSDLSSAKREAKKQRKPIFCTRTRGDVEEMFLLSALTHPLIVEAVETLFVTVNTEVHLEVPGSPDCITLEILNHRGKALLPCFGGNLLLKGNDVLILEAMVKSLEKCSIPVPKYLQLLLQEEAGRTEVLTSGKRRKLDRVAIFGVSNLHVVEAEFAEVGGVLDIQAGLYKGRQILQVTYASKVTSLDSLLRYALLKSYATSIYYQSQEEFVVVRSICEQLRRSFHIVEKMEDSSLIKNIVDGKSGLRKTPLRYVPMTGLQKIHANRLVLEGMFNKATHLLSPKQSEIMMRSLSNVNGGNDSVDLSFADAWKGQSAKVLQAY